MERKSGEIRTSGSPRDRPGSGGGPALGSGCRDGFEAQAAGGGGTRQPADRWRASTSQRRCQSQCFMTSASLCAAARPGTRRTRSGSLHSFCAGKSARSVFSTISGMAEAPLRSVPVCRGARRFPIAAPVTWSRIEAGIPPDAFTMKSPFRALSEPPNRSVRACLTCPCVCATHPT